MNPELKADLDRIFYPRGVAVVGASDRPGNFGLMFTQTFLQMGHPAVFPINPRGETVAGLTSYPAIAAVPHPVDLAVIATLKETLPGIVADASAKGVKGAIIFTSGFREIGEEGERLEREMVAQARSNGLRIVGPNCQGIYCPKGGLAVGPGASRESGPAALISHSGSLTNFLTRSAVSRGMFFAKAISLGNEADLNSADLLEYFGEDPDVKYIIAYLEGSREPRRFFELARRISPQKPIIIWKGGVTQRGARAARSHTGALAASEEVWRALVAQTGIIPVGSAEELIDTLAAFYFQKPPQGRRAAIVSGPGGPAVATSDACVLAGLELAELSSQTRQAIAQGIPGVGTSIDNPIDLGMAASRFPEWYRLSIKALGADPAVDAFLIIGGGNMEVSQAIVSSLKQGGKPAALVMMGEMPGSAEIRDYYREQGLPVFADGRRAAQALGRLADYGDYLRSL